MSRKEDWFFETDVGGVRHGVKVTRTLLDRQTAYQHLQIFETEAYGRMMVLDGYIQTTEADELLYHRLLVQAALARLDRPARQILIIGGGDGGSLREVIRHQPDRAVLAELDEGVVEASRRFLPRVHEGAFDHPCADVHIGDGFAMVRGARDRFDAIIVDATDPDGPGGVLYSQDFYAACSKALTQDGVISLHLGVPFFQAKSARHGWENLSAVFEAPLPLARPVPSYGGGNMLFALASRSGALTNEPRTTAFWSSAEDRLARLTGADEIARLQ